MDQIQVHIVQAQTLKGSLKSRAGFHAPGVCVPEFGGDEQLLPGDAAGPDGPAHRLLITIELGGVNQPIAIFQRLADCALTDRRVLDQVSAKANHRHLRASV